MKTQSYSMIAITITCIMIMQTKSWAMMWIIMEINMVAMTLQLMEDHNKEKMILFLIFQSMPAMCMMTYIACDESTMEKTMSSVGMTVMMMAMACKMGMFPFQNWMMSMSKSMSWMNNFIIMSLQKIIPMVLIVKISLTTTMVTIGVLSMMVASSYIMIMVWMKTFLMASSLMHLTWMIMSAFHMELSPLLYLFIYSMILWTIVSKMKKTQKKSLNNQTKSMTPYKVSMFSLAGIPPTTGFAIKMLVIISMVVKMMPNGLMVIMLMTAGMSFYAYGQLLYKTLHNVNYNEKMMKSYSNKMEKNTMFNMTGAVVVYCI